MNIIDTFSSFVKKVFQKEDINISKLVKEFRLVLLKADIPPSYINEIAKDLENKLRSIKEKYKKVDKDSVVKALYDIFSEKIIEEGNLENLILSKKYLILVGLLGSGKTTTCGKLALLLKRLKRKVLLLSIDTFRKAGIEQLDQISNKIGVDFDSIENYGDLDKMIENIKKIEEKYDHIIIDTPGNTTIDESILSIIKDVKRKLNGCIVYVVSADSGYQSIKILEKVHKEIGIDCIIVSKFDSSAKAGGVLVASKLLKLPIVFYGTGERLDDLEEFKLESIMSRILGVGDLRGILRKFELLKEELEIKEYKEVNVEAIYDSLNFMEKLGGIKKVLQMLPFGNIVNVSDEQIFLGEEKIKKFKAIILSLNKKELSNPNLIRKRIKEIAKGAGVKVKDVEEFLEFIKVAKKLEKFVKGGELNKRDLIRLMRRRWR